MRETDAATALLEVALPHLRASTHLSVGHYDALDRAALDVMAQIAPERLSGESLELTRRPVRGDNPRTLRYDGTVTMPEREVMVDVAILADAVGMPGVGVRSKPLPTPPFWDDAGEAVVRVVGSERLARVRLLLKISGHANRAALWGRYEVFEAGRFTHAYLGEIEHLRAAAVALRELGGPFGTDHR